MTTFVLVAGAWHGAWAWHRVTPLLEATGARVSTPDLTLDRDLGLETHVGEVVAELDAAPLDRHLVLVGHSYAGLVVRQAADRRPDRVTHIVLVDGWAGTDGTSMFSLAPTWFVEAVHTAAQATGDGSRIPAPPPAAFGIDDLGQAAWLQQRLRPHPLRTFTEPTRLGGAVDRIPGTGICCRGQPVPFAQFAKDLGYRVMGLDGPHDIMLTHPEPLARALLSSVPTLECPTSQAAGKAPASDPAKDVTSRGVN